MGTTQLTNETSRIYAKATAMLRNCAVAKFLVPFLSAWPVPTPGFGECIGVLRGSDRLPMGWRH